MNPENGPKRSEVRDSDLSPDLDQLDLEVDNGLKSIRIPPDRKLGYLPYIFFGRIISPTEVYGIAIACRERFPDWFIVTPRLYCWHGLFSAGGEFTGNFMQGRRTETISCQT